MASKGSEETNVIVPKSVADLQRIKLEKLMKNPNKEVVIPEKSAERTPRPPLEFIRNVWGSSAGAGSGDFHVYRGVRRREYARQKFLDEKTAREDADTAYHKKVEENKKAAEERTAKKRAKRLKKKQNKKMKKPQKKEESEEEDESEEENNSDTDERLKGNDEQCECGEKVTANDEQSKRLTENHEHCENSKKDVDDSKQSQTLDKNEILDTNTENKSQKCDFDVS